MNEVLVIPSPSAILDSPVNEQIRSKAAQQPLQTTYQMPSKEQTSNSESVKCRSSAKPKQTKSRNGCVTCKLKRLKCDEKKPGCDQCAKRSVTCGGYKKDFKWRPFEEQNVSDVVKQPFSSTSASSVASSSSSVAKPKTGNGPQRLTKPPTRKSHSVPSDALPERTSTPHNRRSPSQDFPLSQPADLVFPYSLPSSIPPVPPFTFDDSSDPSPTISTETDPLEVLSDPNASGSTEPPLFAPSGSYIGGSSANRVFTDFWPQPSFRADNLDIDPQDASQFPMSASGAQHGWWPLSSFQERAAPISTPMPGIHAKPSDPSFKYALQDRQSIPLHRVQDTGELMRDDDDVEEIVRPANHFGISSGMFQNTTDLFSFLNGSPSVWHYPVKAIPKQPLLGPDSDEMVIARFDKRTCGIMSVKDGPDENPWRTFIMPLMHKYNLIYHTVASMACLQDSTMCPQLLQPGKLHFEQAFAGLKAVASNRIAMEYDVAFAAMLGLAFSEGWGHSTTTGTDYIKQSKLLMYRAIDECQKTPRGVDHLERVKFLCRTWIYIDVIARLTSVDDDESNDFDHVSKMVSGPLEAKVDPLMGVAGTLFPIVGRVANLVKQVCKAIRNTAAMINQATNLKRELEAWQPMVVPENIQDETSTVEHNVQTANAYKWATLLYLHQAVPEILMDSSITLAERTMSCLATVPLTSRTVIVQIYPLLAAGCEAKSSDSRKWVRERWEAMKSRMAIGNVDRCLDVVEEVWHRRDQSASQDANVAGAEPLEDASSSSMNFAHSRTILSSLPRWMQPLDGRDPAAVILGLLPPQRSVSLKPQSDTSTLTDVDPSTGELQREYTVRGRLHWVGVMKDLGWEVLLG